MATWILVVPFKAFISRCSASMAGSVWVCFLAWLYVAFVGLRRLARRTRTIPHLAWCADMSDALQAGMVVFLTAGAFVDIAFQPEIWYFIAMSVSLREYVRRVEQTSGADGGMAHARLGGGDRNSGTGRRRELPGGTGRRGASRVTRQ